MPILEVKEIAPCKKELSIEVAQDLFDDELGKVYQKIAREASLPGFRKGKIPIKIIKSRFEPKAREEAINKSVSRAYGDTIKELELAPIGKPLIDKVKAGKEQPVRFSVTVEHLPKFEIKRISGFDFKWEIIKITDEEVSKELENMADSLSELISVSGRPAEKGDYAIIDFEGSVDGEKFEGGEAKGIQVHLGAGKYIEDLESGVLGMSLGDTKDVEVTFPEDYQNSELAGKKAIFKVRLNEIKEKSLPELNDRFAKEHYEEESLDALKASIRKKMANKEEESGKVNLKEKIFLKLHEANHFEIPESLVESQAEMMVFNGLRQIGFTKELIAKDQARFQSLKEKILPTSRTSVIIQLIMEKLKGMEDFDVDVTEEELQEELKKHRPADGSMSEEAIRKEESHREYIKSNLLDNKTLDLLIDKNNVEKVYIDRPKNISDNKQV